MESSFTIQSIIRTCLRKHPWKDIQGVTGFSSSQLAALYKGSAPCGLNTGGKRGKPQDDPRWDKLGELVGAPTGSVRTQAQQEWERARSKRRGPQTLVPEIEIPDQELDRATLIQTNERLSRIIEQLTLIVSQLTGTKTGSLG